jgi:hypothetical protein
MLSEKLQVSTALGTASAGQLLQNLAFDCTDVADDLLKAVNAIASKSAQSKWE